MDGYIYQDVRVTRNEEVGFVSEGLLEVVATTKRTATGQPVQKDLRFKRTSLDRIIHQNIGIESRTAT